MSKMNYFLNLRLERRTGINIAIILWTQDDIRALMARFPFAMIENERQWKAIESAVIAKAEKLPLPRSLKEDIVRFIKPIGLQMLKWMDYHVGNGYVDAKSMPQFCWTQHGIVDKKRTAKLLIMNEHLGIIERYKLACIYCLEDDIRLVWNKMSRRSKKCFSYIKEESLQVDRQKLVVFWTFLMKGEINKLAKIIKRDPREYTPYQYAFIWAVIRGNETATEYFLKKFTPEERNFYLISASCSIAKLRRFSKCFTINFPKECYSNILCFLLTQMDPQQQLMAIKVCHYGALKCFLDWPWQDFFMKTAHYVWEFHSQDICICLYEDIVRKIVDGYKDYDYQLLLREFWRQSPATHKRYIIQESTKRKTFLSVLSELKDEETISLILKDASLTEKESILFLQGKTI